MNLAASLPAQLALRYIRKGKDGQSFSMTSLLSFLGISLAVCAMILVLSIMNGFRDHIEQTILTVVPELTLTRVGGFDDLEATLGSLQNKEGVQGIAPFIEGKVMVSGPSGNTAVSITGISRHYESGVSRIPDSLVDGSLDQLFENRYSLILGYQTARKLGVSTGDRVRVVIPQVVHSPMGMLPRHRNFRVAGIFRVFSDLDKSAALTDLDTAATLFRKRRGDGKPEISSLRIKTEDSSRILHVASDLADDPDYRKDEIITWHETHRELLSAISLEKKVTTLLLFAVIFVATFNIVSILSMTVSQKRRHIALLQVMGMEPSSVRTLFALQGLYIGIGGVLVGMVTGVIFATFFSEIFSFLDSLSFVRAWFDFSFYASVPTRISITDLALVSVGAIFLSVVASLVPAMNADRFNPGELINS
jgi:lipoprotein-releasing system permease protein